MRSYQIAAGIYAQPNRHWILSLEGYYKLSKHLLQYSSWLGIEPPAENWDSQVIDGKGLFYGLEADATYRTNHLTLSGYIRSPGTSGSMMSSIRTGITTSMTIAIS